MRWSPAQPAEVDELAVAHLGHRLAGEGPGGHPFDRGAQAAQVAEERAVAFGEGVEAAHVLAQLLEPADDQVVMLELVRALLGEHRLGVDLGGRRQPVGGDLGRLELALQGHLEQGDHLGPAAGFGLEGGVAAQAFEEQLHLAHQAGDEGEGVRGFAGRGRIGGWTFPW